MTILTMPLTSDLLLALVSNTIVMTEATQAMAIQSQYDPVEAQCAKACPRLMWGEVSIILLFNYRWIDCTRCKRCNLVFQCFYFAGMNIIEIKGHGDPANGKSYN